MSRYRFPRGDKHFKWKGGRSIEGGIPKILNPQHPRANSRGYVRESILVAEQAIEIEMPTDAVVHHWDRDPQNNKPSNLLICQDQAYHRIIHRRMLAMEACGHPEWLKCIFCGIYSPPAELVILQRRGRVYSERWYHQTCNTAYCRNYRNRELTQTTQTGKA
jgi:hypothetical protein